MTSADNTVAPAFKLESASYLNFSIQYLEYVKSAMAVDMFLPAFDGANFYVGAYDLLVNNLNPIKRLPVTTDTTITASTWKPAMRELDPSKRPAGSLGDAVMFQASKGPFEKTGTVTIDSSFIIQKQSKVKEENDKYEKEGNEFEMKKDTYEKDAEKEQ